MVYGPTQQSQTVTVGPPPVPPPDDVWIAFGSGHSRWDDTWPVGPSLDRIGPPSRSIMENEIIRFECDDTGPYGRFFQNAAFQYLPSGSSDAVAIELLGKLDYDELNGSPIREFAVFENATSTPGSGDLIHYEIFPRIQKEEAIRYFHRVRMLFDVLPGYWPVYDGFEYEEFGVEVWESDSRYFQNGPVLGGLIVSPPPIAGDQGSRAVLLRSGDYNNANGVSIYPDFLTRAFGSPLAPRIENRVFFQADFLVPFSWDLAGHDPLSKQTEGLHIGWSNQADDIYTVTVNPKEGIFVDSATPTKIIDFPAFGAWHRIRVELDISAGTANIFLDGVQEFTSEAVNGWDSAFSSIPVVAPEFATAMIMNTTAPSSVEQEARKSWTAYIDNVIVDVW